MECAYVLVVLEIGYLFIAYLLLAATEASSYLRYELNISDGIFYL